MQVTYNPRKPWKFWLTVLAVVLVGLSIWFGIRYLDKTAQLARAYVNGSEQITSRLGKVKDTTLYKVRYLDPKDEGGCYAEYFFYVNGARSGTLNLRVLGCGSTDNPEFRILDRD